MMLIKMFKGLSGQGRAVGRGAFGCGPPGFHPVRPGTPVLAGVLRAESARWEAVANDHRAWSALRYGQGGLWGLPWQGEAYRYLCVLPLDAFDMKKAMVPADNLVDYG